MDSIHGHAVMEMMLASDAAFTTETLVAAIDAEFGPDARFHTCSAENMTARDLVAFLAGRGKFVAQETGFTTDPNKICAH